MMMQKQSAFGRNQTSSFEFWSFPGQAIMPYDTLLCCWAAAVNRSSGQPCDHEGKQLILYSVFIVYDEFAQPWP